METGNLIIQLILIQKDADLKAMQVQMAEMAKVNNVLGGIFDSKLQWSDHIAHSTCVMKEC